MCFCLYNISHTSQFTDKMSSSESDEDCYGNITKRLQSLKNNYRPEKPITRLETAVNVESNVYTSQNVENTSIYDDTIINLLEHVPSVPGLSSTSITNTSQVQKRKTRKSARLSGAQTVTEVTNTPVARKNIRRKGKCDATVAPLNPPETVLPQPTVAPPMVSPAVRARSTTTRRAGRGARARGRGRQSMARLLRDVMMSSIIYSVGNTDEYPDAAENVPIFSKSHEGEGKAIELVDLSSSFGEDLENEEMSVKVCWQQTEYVKFNIRRFQKLSQIFDFFSKRESISTDKLLFTLRGRILRPDDTPDSVEYNIAMFIDGGVVNSSIAGISGSTNKENHTATGIFIKFQCQNSKRPFETHIEPEQKLSTAMMKCAEHFELPYAKLRFILDGDGISPNTTPADHGLDHGDCIDVKLIS